jgi:hypothetical protein
VSPDVQTTDPDGIDYGWVMQVTFITTLFVGTPVVAVLSLSTQLTTWPDRALFAVRVGAAVWLVVLVGVYLYARQYRSEEDSESEDADSTEAETDTGGRPDIDD